MTTIRTVAELDALPPFSVVIDCERDPWRKLPTGRWTITDTHGIEPEELMEMWSPVTLVSDPSVPVADHRSIRCSIRCSGRDSCTTTTPLPVGSFWCCPECAQLTDTVTRGTA